jgi:uncharacterized protein (TIGR02145 family)
MKNLIKLFALLIAFIYTINAQVTDTIHVEPGWNLLSLPLKVVDGAKSSLFPSAISDAFVYQDNYLPKDTLENGYGFWVKFDSAETFLFEGESVHRDTINVSAGWNMIGSLTEIIHVNMVVTEPPGIIVSNFFNYVPQSGYEASDTIKPGVGYWVKVNQSGSIILFSGPPCPGLPTVTYAGKVYNTVQIGNQCWLKENLYVGTMIPGSDTAKDNGIIEKYCYNNDPANCNTYGGLYQWNEAMQYTTAEGAQGICPSGWHIPTMAEFQTLSTTVSGDGNALKAIGQGTGGGAGTNTSGFSALLSGYRSHSGYFYSLSYYATFWSSTEGDPMSADYMGLYFGNGYVTLGNYDYKDYGFSVRCVKD